MAPLIEIETEGRKLLFLDDWRFPIDCATYMYQRKVDCEMYHKSWDIVRSFGSFKEHIINYGVPDVLSIDYDLADVEELREELPFEHWFNLDENREYTGLDCVDWLLKHCFNNDLKFPEYVIHSTNPDGREKIQELINNFETF